MEKKTGGGNSHELSEFIAWRIVMNECFLFTLYLFIHKEQKGGKNILYGALSNTWVSMNRKLSVIQRGIE